MTAPPPPASPLRPHVALRHAILARTLGQAAADAYAAAASAPPVETPTPAR